VHDVIIIGIFFPYMYVYHTFTMNCLSEPVSREPDTGMPGTMDFTMAL